ncbi:CRAL-TRIO domain-containing protein [Massariosphaeria phaeospora]|uniref:CRAL-TRIO domain-containing protein n=1 Tax=Massariosphaeria phaeospora TaxID=100035 RepID=A0A7C8MCK2_9PLEO|nr:CRAL-TRIO domain-containing protein [Massariosphaeria phaeospora]
MSVLKPFPEPAAGCTPAAPAPLTAEQQTKYDELLTAAKSWETLPTSAKGVDKAPLTDDERMWLTRQCLLRYLRATKWTLPQAIKRLQDSLVWRREYGTDGFTADYISEENATGKQVFLGYDKEGRPCLYLLPNKQNTKNSPKQVQHLVYMLERTLDVAPPGQESLALLIDFRNSSSGSQPPIGTAREVLHILQNHYPERLGRALITHLPWYITVFLKLVGPFIDPVTKTKMRYNEPLIDHVPSSQLMKNAGGEADFQYDHSVYWPALAELAAQRRKERKERWETAGKLIGENEVYLWGGDEKSVGGHGANGAVADSKTDDTPVPVDTNSKAAYVEDADSSLASDVAKLDVKNGEEAKKTAA